MKRWMIAALLLIAVPARGVEYAQIDHAYKTMTSVEWAQYSKSLAGTHVCWSGVVVDVKEQWFGGHEITVNMNEVGVQDVYLEDLDLGGLATTWRKGQQIHFCGAIKSVLSVFGPAVTFSKPSLRP